MANFLVDVNLPYYFSLWNDKGYVHQLDIDDTWTDQQIWRYAKENNLTIITKDTDFYNISLISEPPPKVIHLRIGNMKLKELHGFLHKVWPDVLELIKTCKLSGVCSK
jgi:predicted nuclease of predicted toxin-antitoxin system